MGKEQNSAYYDKVYKTSTEYAKPWQESRYRKVWERMMQRFYKDNVVLDLGCGVGQCARMFFDKGFERYIGVDFSKEAIEKAISSIDLNGFTFALSDLFQFFEIDHINYHLYKMIFIENSNVNFFLCETLEHIEKDTELLDLICQNFPGNQIAISVPTFDDPSHVRHFKSTSEVRERYGEFMTSIDLSQIGPWIIMTGKTAKA